MSWQQMVEDEDVDWPWHWLDIGPWRLNVSQIDDDGTWNIEVVLKEDPIVLSGNGHASLEQAQQVVLDDFVTRALEWVLAASKKLRELGEEAA